VSRRDRAPDREESDARDLALRVALRVHAVLAERGGGAELALVAGRGAGDWTYGLDDIAETEVDTWLAERATRGPISLMTEDRGWRHLGPEGELQSFDHGGPRIAIDPIDGTRPLMWDLRAAWCVVSAAGPGAGQPRLSDLIEGVVAEIPDTRAARARVLHARRGEGCDAFTIELADHTHSPAVTVEPQQGAELLHGFYPFFTFSWDLRPELTAVAARFFSRLHEHEGLTPDGAFDDGYLSSGGQLALLVLGKYRMLAELRSTLSKRSGRPTFTAKPYDVAGAILCAREAGCVVCEPDGSELDFPIDVESPVDYAAYATRALAQRLGPHLEAVLATS